MYASSTLQNTSGMTTCLPSHKLSKEDRLGIAGEAGTNLLV